MIRYILSSLFAAALLTTGYIANASPSNKWRLEFSGGAESDGVIEIRVMPKGGEALTCTAEIPKGTGENRVAKMVVEACREQLPEEAFHIERDDGEDVLFKKRRGAANFDIEIVSNTVKDVRINRDRE